MITLYQENGMMSFIKNTSKLGLIALVLIMFTTGCKSKKLAMEASRTKEKARIEQEAALRKQQEEDARRKDAEERERAKERERKEAEAALNKSERDANAPTARLNEYFESIAGANNTASANNSINEALALFASPDTPVLIVIHEAAGIKDYDKPTTIRKYLNYLKDQKKNSNAISDLKIDSAGKIMEIELRKN